MGDAVHFLRCSCRCHPNGLVIRLCVSHIYPLLHEKKKIKQAQISHIDKHVRDTLDMLSAGLLVGYCRSGRPSLPLSRSLCSRTRVSLTPKSIIACQIKHILLDFGSSTHCFCEIYRINCVDIPPELGYRDFYLVMRYFYCGVSHAWPKSGGNDPVTS